MAWLRSHGHSQTSLTAGKAARVATFGVVHPPVQTPLTDVSGRVSASRCLPLLLYHLTRGINSRRLPARCRSATVSAVIGQSHGCPLRFLQPARMHMYLSCVTVYRKYPYSISRPFSCPIATGPLQQAPRRQSPHALAR